jgi:hypothetical protein
MKLHEMCFVAGREIEFEGLEDDWTLATNTNPEEDSFNHVLTFETKEDAEKMIEFYDQMYDNHEFKVVDFDEALTLEIAFCD